MDHQELDPAKLETLKTLETLKPEILKNACKNEAEDIYQDVCLKVLKESSDYPWTKASLKATARNLAIDKHRRRTRVPFRPLETTWELCSQDRNPHQALEAQEQAETLRTALNRLRPEVRDLLLSEEPVRDLAVRHGVPIETVRTRMKRAKQDLTKHLKTY
jgi:RNA polymerase sigma factor (sigma-70 family)